jgi:NTE family protein
LISIKEQIDALDPNKSINLVLGGGALKGAAHVPLLEYLEERKIKVNAISGTSAGALVGALYGSGKTPKEILDFFLETPIFKYAWLTPFSNGMFNSMKYQKYFEAHIRKTFKELDFPLHVCATNMSRSESVYFNEGQLYHKLLASCAVPGIFKPVLIDDEMYSDGAVMDNFPLLPFDNDDKLIIGSFLRAPVPVLTKALKSKRKVIVRSVVLQRQEIEREKLLLPDISIIHDLNHFSAFKQKDVMKIYQKSKDSYFS